MNITVINISFLISFIAVIVCLIILWQFITGREYWGESDNSMILPSAIISLVPILNITWWIFVMLLYISRFGMAKLMSIRENAVSRREKRIRSDNKA